MKALNIFLCIVFLIGLADFTIAAKDEVTSITFLEDKSFEEITVILKKENKLGVLYFGGPNCGWCVKLEKEVFMVDSVITYIESNFVPFKCGSELRKKYTVFGIPHAIIINERGDVVDRIAGYYPADKYLKKLSVSAMDNVSKSEPKKEKTYKNLKEAYEANPDDKKTAYDYAYKLMNTGDMGSALPVFESITNVSFDDEVKDAWVLLDLARCYEMADRKMKPSEPYRKKAVKTYEKAIEIGLPSEIQKVKTYGQLVFHSFNGKEYDKVIKYASMIPEPKKYENRRDMRINYEAKFNRIYLPFAYYYIGDEDMGRKELIKLFENTAKEESPYSILQRWTGYCHMYNIFLKEAEEWAEKAVELYYERVSEEGERVKNIEDDEERKKAESNYKILTDAMCYQVLSNYARILGKNGKYEKTIEIWEKFPGLPESRSSKRNKQRAQAYLGAVYIKSGQVEKGEKIFEEILNWEVKSSAYFELIMVCNEYKIKTREALEWIESGKDEYKLLKSSWIMDAYAELLFEKGEVEKAIEWEEKAIEQMDDIRFTSDLKKFKAALKN